MSEHIVSKKIYFMVFGALMVGTIATYLVALRDMDSVLFTGANTVIALTIAFTKASLVVLFFMHVKYSSRLIAVYVLSALFWLGVMFTLTMSDFSTRVHVAGAPADKQAVTEPVEESEQAAPAIEHKQEPAH
jgi:cytochrome c oxidase subunit IV